MRYLTFSEVLELHRRIIHDTGGAAGVRDLAGVQSAVAQPLMTFDGEELYRTLEEKAAAICYSLVLNHPFVDGNKRIGHAAMEIFLVLNGYEISADIDNAERLFLDLAAGKVDRGILVNWISRHMKKTSVRNGAEQSDECEPE